MIGSADAREAVEWLAEEGFVRPDDCVMMVADGTGDFVGEASHRARIIVFMDTDRGPSPFGGFSFLPGRALPSSFLGRELPCDYAEPSDLIGYEGPPGFGQVPLQLLGH